MSDGSYRVSSIQIAIANLKIIHQFNLSISIDVSEYEIQMLLFFLPYIDYKAFCLFNFFKTKSSFKIHATK